MVVELPLTLPLIWCYSNNSSWNPNQSESLSESLSKDDMQLLEISEKICFGVSKIHQKVLCGC